MRPLLVIVAAAVALYAFVVSYGRQPALTSGAVLVTGASSGIGRDAAFHLARNGFHVFATYRKDSDRASLEEQAASAGLSSLFVALYMDVSVPDSVSAAERAIDAAAAARGFPALVAVVNNAGIGGRNVPLELDSEAELRNVMEVNFFGAMRVLRTFLPALRRTRGRVVSISSLKGAVATPGTASYCASKAALDMATRVAARETHHLGVTMVTVQPGYIISNIRANVPRDVVKAQFALAATEAGRVYPGFQRYLNRTFGEPAATGRGVPATVTSEAILFAIMARWPGPVLRAGGLEVYTATWLPWLIPDALEDAIAAIIFRYGERATPDQASSFLSRVKNAIGA